MYCKYCGAKIGEYDKYCPKCGKQTEGQLEKIVYVQKYDPQAEFNSKRTENRKWGILAMIFTFVFFPLGFLFSIIGLLCYRDKNDPYHGSNLAKCIVALVLSSAAIAIIIWAFSVTSGAY